MPGPGRNQPCPCASGRKTKRCCGQQRGPAEDQIARAHVAARCQQAIPDLAELSEDALDILWQGLIDLPAIALLAPGHAARTDRPRSPTPPRIRQRRRPRLGLGRADRGRHTDRHPTTTRPTR